MTDLKFGSCTVLSSSSPLIEASKFEVESVSDSISAIEAPISMWLRLCAHYIDDLLPYEPLELCSYWGCGQVFHFRLNHSRFNWMPCHTMSVQDYDIMV